jgi:pyochelin biosynthesis protein PchC
MIADILPVCLASADAFDDSPVATALPDVEATDVEELVVPSVDKRRRVSELPSPHSRINNLAWHDETETDVTSVTTDDELWLQRFHLGRFHRAPAYEPGNPRLVCFPHAGGSASYFSEFARLLAAVLEVVAVQYPGRQERRAEPCFGSMVELADQVFPVLKPLTDRPLALFGHSMGAIAAFEVARRLADKAAANPVALFVSGRRAPSRYRAEYVHQQDDDGLVAQIKMLSGTNPRILDNEELLRMVLPAIRSDYKAIETYQYQDGPKLRCPIHALVGDADPQATIEEVAAWEEYTTGQFTLSVVPGGHFYLNEQQVGIAKTVTTHLACGH